MRIGCCSAPTATALATASSQASALGPWGISKLGVVATIEEFNAAVAAGQGAELRIPRLRSPFGLVQPPFRALLVRAAITFTNGGVDVDTGMRVLDRDGAPIFG